MALAGIQRRRQRHLRGRGGDAARRLASPAGGALKIRRFGEGDAMSCVRLGILSLVGVVAVAGCTDFKRSIGLEPTMPDEFAVESRAPLTIPPDFDLRPPTP